MQGRQIEESISVLHNGKIYTLERKVKNHLYGSGSVEVISVKINHEPDQREVDVLEAIERGSRYSDLTKRNSFFTELSEKFGDVIDVFRQIVSDSNE